MPPKAQADRAVGGPQRPGVGQTGGPRQCRAGQGAV